MSHTLTEEETDELLRQFEEMLNEETELELEDFGSYNNIKYPDNKDLENPDEPPPLPNEVKCKHEKRKKVIISANLKFWICEKCKDDLGDA